MMLPSFRGNTLLATGLALALAGPSLAIDWTTYHDALTINTELQQIGQDYSFVATHIPILTTAGPIGVIKAGASAGPKPAILVTGGQYANEWQSVNTVGLWIQQLVEGYGTDAQATMILETFDIYLVPLMNPGGYQYSRSTDPTWQKNGGALCNSALLDANWPVFWDGTNLNLCSVDYPGPAPLSEPETQALRTFITSVSDLILHVDVRSGPAGGVGPGGCTGWIGSPWVNGDCTLASQSLFDDLMQVFSDATQAVNGIRYAPGNASLYQTPHGGAFIDWSYGENGIVALQVMMRNCNGTNFEIFPAAEEGWQGVVAMLDAVGSVPPAVLSTAGSILNDCCPNAELLPEAAVKTFDMTGASTDGPAGSCAIDQDVWYRYTAVDCGTLTVSSTGFANAVLEAFDSATCPPTAPESLACGGNSIAFGVEAGAEYLIRLGSDTVGLTGSGTIEATIAPFTVANDDCSNAIALTDGANVAFATTCATTDGPAGCSAESDIWYAYQANDCGTVTISTSAASFTPLLAAYETTTCPPAASDEVGCTLGGSLNVPVEGGETLLIRVGGSGSAPPVSGNGVVSLAFAMSPPPGCAVQIPSHASNVSFGSRGFWFDAPTDLVIDGLRVPTTMGSAPQTIQVIRINDTFSNFQWPARSSSYQTLGYYQSVPGTCWIGTSISICTGDRIGILGGRSPDGTTTHTSYTPYLGGTFPSSIHSSPVALYRLASDQSVAAGRITNFFSSAFGEQGRIEMSIQCPQSPVPACLCTGDVDNDGFVGKSDLIAIMTNFFTFCGSCPEDVTGNGSVNFGDIIAVLSNWGPC